MSVEKNTNQKSPFCADPAFVCEPEHDGNRAGLHVVFGRSNAPGLWPWGSRTRLPWGLPVQKSPQQLACALTWQIMMGLEGHASGHRDGTSNLGMPHAHRDDTIHGGHGHRDGNLGIMPHVHRDGTIHGGHGRGGNLGIMPHVHRDGTIHIPGRVHFGLCHPDCRLVPLVFALVFTAASLGAAWTTGSGEIQVHWHPALTASKTLHTHKKISCLLRVTGSC